MTDSNHNGVKSLSYRERVYILPHGSVQRKLAGIVEFSHDTKRCCNVKLETGRVLIGVNYLYVEKRETNGNL